jgi:hypothetical protein
MAPRLRLITTLGSKKEPRHACLRPRPDTRTERGLRLPPQYHNLNSQHPQGPPTPLKKEPRYVRLKKPSTPSVKEPHSMSPYRVFTERDALSPETIVYSFIYICRSPQLRSPPTKCGETYSHCPRSPTRAEGLHTMDAAWFPQGIVNDTAVTTPVPCSLQHDTFHFGVGRPELRWPVCVVVAL